MHKRATLANIAKDPDALTILDIADLRALWALHLPKKPHSHPSLVQAIGRTYKWRQELDNNPQLTVVDLAR